MSEVAEMAKLFDQKQVFFKKKIKAWKPFMDFLPEKLVTYGFAALEGLLERQEVLRNFIALDNELIYYCYKDDR